MHSQSRFAGRTVKTLVVILLIVSLNSLSPNLLTLSAHAQPTTQPAAQGQLSIKPLTSYANLSITVGSTVTYEVHVTNASSINAFLVAIQYNPPSQTVVLGNPKIDFSGNIFGTNVFVSDECVDGTPVPPGNNCALPVNAFGVVTLGLVNLPGNITAPVNGRLFTITFNVVARGFSTLHFLQAFLINGAQPKESQQLIIVTSDGYFSNISCPTTSTFVCKPPTVDFTFTPARPIVGRATELNASASKSQNPNGNITSYAWDWGDGQVGITTASPLISHQYVVPQIYTVTLGVTDNYSISGYKTILLQVIRVWLDLAIRGLDLKPGAGVVPGTRINITATVINFSTKAENATVEVLLENNSLAKTTALNLADGGGQRLVSTSLDTSQFRPRVYVVTVLVDPIRNSTTGQIIENETANNSVQQYLQLIDPLPPGFGILFGLGILPSFGIGVAVLGVIVVVLGLVRRKPTLLEES